MKTFTSKGKYKTAYRVIASNPGRIGEGPTEDIESIDSRGRTVFRAAPGYLESLKDLEAFTPEEKHHNQ